MELSPDESVKFLYLRAIEWANLPSFVSMLYVPPLLILFPWLWIAVCQVSLSLLWCMIRYRSPSLKISVRLAIGVNFGKWIMAVVGCIGLLVQHRPAMACVALGWPLFVGCLRFGGEVGRIEQAFINQKSSETRGIDREAMFDEGTQ